MRANTKIAYYDWIRARAQRVLAEESLGSSRARLEDARLGLQAGTVAPADALALETLVASSETAVSQARSFERLAPQNLAILVGNDVEFTIGEDVLANAEDEDVGELDTLVEQGMRGVQQSIQFSAFFQGKQFVTATNCLSIDQYLRESLAACAVHHLAPQGLIHRCVKVLKGNTLLTQ